MIKTKSDLHEWLKHEKKYYLGEVNGIKQLHFGQSNKIWKFIKCLRHYEYHHNNRGGIYHIIAEFIWKYRKDSLGGQLGYEIGPNVFDKGLHIYHSGTLIVNGSSRVGKNCTIIGSTCLGNRNGGKGPTLGENCELGMNSVIIGDITLGNNVRVGAGAVVVKSYLELGVSLAGVPAKIVKKDNVLVDE